VSAGGARRGRRDNGLHAADYAAAGDVDPRVGEHLLDVLAAGGIAAYLQPSADMNPLLRTTTFPARPTDRLYVDSTHLEQARQHLAQLADDQPNTSAPRQGGNEPGRGGRQDDVDREWALIIAGFDTSVDPTAAPWPAAEGLPDGTAEPTAAPDRRPESPGLQSAVDVSGINLNRRRDDEPSLLDALDTFGVDDDDKYTPPPPPPLPKLSKYTVAGVLAVLLGFVLFLFPSLLPIGKDVVTLLGFTSIVAGAVTLVWRLRSGDDEDDYDDGAVV
jgi:hypothetical protein